MGIIDHLHKSIATALVAAVGFSTPAWADATRLDQLFEQLQQAGPAEVDRIEAQIISEWGKTGSAAMDLLLRRGEDAIEDGTPEIAVEHFTALVDHAPDFAEGYHGRATAYYQLGQYGPAIDDLRQTLVLEPRHFGAMTGIAVVLQELGRLDEALEVWQQVRAFAPNDAEVAGVIARLETQLVGEAL